MIPTTQTQITFPTTLGTLREFDFLSSAERSEQLLMKLEALIKGSEERIQRSIEKFRSDTKNSLEGVSVESEKISQHATANRAVSIRREEAEATEPKRLAIIQELLAIAAEAQLWAAIVQSPQMLLQRLAISLGDQKRGEYLALLGGASVEELDAFALIAIGENRVPLAAALCQHVAPLRKEDRPGFTARTLAESFIGKEFQAREKIRLNPGMARDLDKSYRTGQKQSIAASLTRAAARLAQ